jgi:protein O-GlcNAc transferase
MTMLEFGDINWLLAEGLAAHQAGRLVEAEGRYRTALTTDPTNPDALHLIGVVALQNGRIGDAAASVRQALTVAPAQPSFWNTLGVAERAAGQLDAAAVSFQQAVEIAPDYLEAWGNLATTHELRGDQDAEAAALERVTALQPGDARAWGRRGVLAFFKDELHLACAYFQESLALAPDAADVWSNLGAVQVRLGHLADAEANQRRAVTLQPDHVAAWNNLGNVLVARSRWQEAAEVLVGVVQVAPDDANGWINFGHALKGLERYDEARDAYERALTIRPDSAVALVGIGDTVQKQDNPFGAIDWYERAIALKPDHADAYEHLGIAVQTVGDIVRAETLFRQCLALDPERPNVHSALIFVLDLLEGSEQEAIAERRRWNARFGRPAGAPPAMHANDRDPARRLRVGYVSADYRQHSAAYAIMPILRAHDRTQVEVVCYSGVTKPDHITGQIREIADRWHDVAALSDDELAALIRHDEIDVLVDLGGHSGDNRLPVFSKEPAPVQVTAWGYAASTGLDTIRYFLADPLAVPAASHGSYSEEVVSLPSVLCYEAPAYASDVAPPPMLRRGHVTFGAFNRLPKISVETVVTWGRVMAAVPTAHLVLKCSGADTSPAQEQLQERLAAVGINLDRVTLLGATPHPSHLATHSEIDIMLDTFPQSGGVTTLDALVMGVPVVTLLGKRVPGRISASLLATLGLDDLIARSPDEYVEIAARLAGDPKRLTHERETLRARLYASPIGNARVYTGAVEDVYRELWGRWCQEAASGEQGTGVDVGPQTEAAS